MPSAIDPTKPQDVVPAVKADLRANLAAAKGELDHGGFAEGFTPMNYGLPASSKVLDHLAAIDAVIPSLGGGAGLTGWTDVKANFGATGNGTTDDTAALQNALNSGASVVYFPAGTYRVTSPLTIGPGTQVLGAGPQRTVIDGRGSSPSNTAGILQCLGTLTSLPSFSSSMTIGDGAINFSSTVSATLNHGDWIRLRDNTTNSLNSFGDIDGFFAQVQQAEGSIAYPATPVIRTLPAPRTSGPLSNVQAHKLDGRGLVLRDFTLLCQAFDAKSDDGGIHGLGIFCQNLANIYLSRVDALGGASTTVQLRSCAGARLDNCRVTAHNGTWNGQGSYAIWVRGSGYVTLVGCDFKGARSTTNFEGHDAPTHDVQVIGGFIGAPGTALFSMPDSTTVNALSWHEGTYNVHVSGVHVRGRVSLRGDAITISDCLIEGVAVSDGGANSGTIQTTRLTNLNVRIVNNDIIVRNTHWKGSGCLFEMSDGELHQDPGVVGSLLFANNRIWVAINTTQALFHLADTDAKSPATGKVHVLGNQVIRTEVSTSQPWFNNNVVDMEELYVLDNIAPAKMTLGTTGAGFARFLARNVWDGRIEYVGLPTSSPGGSGRLWSDGGTLRIT